MLSCIFPVLHFSYPLPILVLPFSPSSSFLLPSFPSPSSSSPSPLLSSPPLYTHSLPGFSLLQSLSRTPKEKPSGRNNSDLYSQEHESGIFITGRIVLNMWKRMKAELKLQSYSKHHVAQQLLSRKVRRELCLCVVLCSWVLLCTAWLIYFHLNFNLFYFALFYLFSILFNRFTCLIALFNFYLFLFPLSHAVWQAYSS